jgi:hypothetical protein
MMYIKIELEEKKTGKIHVLSFKIESLEQGNDLVEFYKRNIRGAKLKRATVTDVFDNIP